MNKNRHQRNSCTLSNKYRRLCQVGTVFNGLLLTLAFKRSKCFRNYCYNKDITKKTLIVLVQAKKLIAVVQLKKSWEESNIGISSKYLINTQLQTAELNPENCIDLRYIKDTINLFIVTNVIRCSRLPLWVGYFICYLHVLVQWFINRYNFSSIKETNWLINKRCLFFYLMFLNIYY